MPHSTHLSLANPFGQTLDENEQLALTPCRVPKENNDNETRKIKNINKIGGRVMTITSFFMIVGIIGLIAFIGTVIYFHKQEVMPQ